MAAIRFAIDDILDKVLQFVAILRDDSQPDFPGVGFEGVLALQAFRVGMNVMAVKESHDLHTAGTQRLNWINGAWGATYMQ